MSEVANRTEVDEIIQRFYQTSCLPEECILFFVIPLKSGADLGGGGAPPSGIRPPADPKGPPFDTFSEIHFWPTDPKIFRLWRQYILTLRGSARQKKRVFLSKFFKKCPKTAFLTVFSKNLPAAQTILP